MARDVIGSEASPIGSPHSGRSASDERTLDVFEELDGAGTLALAAELTAPYRVCFAEPPWNESEEQLTGFREQLGRAVCRAGFRALVARDAADRLVGGLLRLAHPGRPRRQRDLRRTAEGAGNADDT
jgi:hypothetical protein